MSITPLWKLERQPRGFSVGLFLAALIPAVVIATWVLSDLFKGTSYLSSDPIKDAEHLFGNWTLRFLILTLAITPLRRITHWNWLAKHRRTLGLFAFGYAITHLLTWALLDVQIGVSEYVGWSDIRTDILKRPFITIGMTCLLLMVPLAITSTKGMIRRLGKRWGQLHKLVYLIAVLAIIHYWMAVKLDIRGPAIYGAILALLLGWRWRESRRKKETATTSKLAAPA
jgi:sulfoxide reductase heme-binding subunit YedZ